MPGESSRSPTVEEVGVRNANSTNNMQRLRQAVIAAVDLDATVARLREQLALGQPYNDPSVSYFGLRNAVFALGDTFLEVVSPVRDDAPAMRQLQRRRASVCGYMAMIQIADLTAARTRVAHDGVREVFEVELDDIAEVHLHPADVGGAIVALSEPRPPESWRWGGEGWSERAVDGPVTGITVAVADPDRTRERWERLAGGALEATFIADDALPGLVEIRCGDRVVNIAELAD